MNDKCIFENLLQLTKGSADLYLHGTIESSTENIHTTFHDILPRKEHIVITMQSVQSKMI